MTISSEGGLTHDEIAAGLTSLGIDLDCVCCMETFYWGSSSCTHTCPRFNRTAVLLGKPVCDVRIVYRNYRGEVAERRIQPLGLWFGFNQWHPIPSWLLRAYDLDKKAERLFSLADIQSWSSDPPFVDPSPTKGNPP